MTAYGNLKAKNSQDYAQKPQRKCTLMNSASVCDERWGIWIGSGMVESVYYTVHSMCEVELGFGVPTTIQ
jgi:hypothetical protein